MKELKIDISGEQLLPDAAKQLLAFAGGIKIITLEAPMGAGKTTLIKQLCKALGSHDHFSSPTYSIVNEYAGPGGKLFHFDLYRLKSSEELFDLGFEEYAGGNSYCFIEWPEIALDLLPRPFLNVKITVDQDRRLIEAQIINN